MTADDQLPDVGQAIASVLQNVPQPQHALVIALAERLAATRYRRWASEFDDATQRAGLLLCAEREEEIARRVEALYPKADAEQSAILSNHPEIIVLNAALFDGRPLLQQLTIQARGERLGAHTWRSLAGAAQTDKARLAFLVCAPLEEQSAVFLEALIATLSA